MCGRGNCALNVIPLHVAVKDVGGLSTTVTGVTKLASERQRNVDRPSRSESLLAMTSKLVIGGSATIHGPGKEHAGE